MDISATKLWFSCPQANPAASQRLFCFPYAGGNASTYFNWHRWLDPTIELWIVQMPGRTNRFNEAPIAQMDDLIEQLYQAMQPLLDKPFCLFGHSLGCRVAFALMDKFATEDSSLPEHFFASASAAPHLKRHKPPTTGLTDAEFLKVLSRLGGTPPLLLQHTELMELALPMLRADFNLAETYQYPDVRKFPVKVSVLCGTHDVDVSTADATAWHTLFTHNTELTLVDGNHFYIEHQPQTVIEVINKIRSRSAEMVMDSKHTKELNV